MTPDERTARDTIFRCWQSGHYLAFEDDAKDACADCIAAALAAEREACCRAICWYCAWTPETPGAIRHVEAAHLGADGWVHRYRYAPTEPNYLTGCDASWIRDRGEA